MVPLFSLAKT